MSDILWSDEPILVMMYVVVTRYYHCVNSELDLVVWQLNFELGVLLIDHMPW